MTPPSLQPTLFPLSEGSEEKRLLGAMEKLSNVADRPRELGGVLGEPAGFLIALALWKIQKLLASPFRFRSGCHLRCTALKSYEQEVELDVDIRAASTATGFGAQPVTDVFWPREELRREGQAGPAKSPDEGEESEETEA